MHRQHTVKYWLSVESIATCIFGLGKNSNSSRYITKKKKLKEKLKAASLTWLLAKLPGCVSECRKMLQLVYCDRALIFSPRTVDHPGITLLRMYWVRMQYADLLQQRICFD